MEPFSIACTTCQARLRVRDESVIGQILTCPKCGSMVLVEPVAAVDDASRDASPMHQSDSDAAAGVTSAAFEDADGLFDEPQKATVPEAPTHKTRPKKASAVISPDLIDTVEDLSVQAEVGHKERTHAEPASDWHGTPSDCDESDGESAAQLSPPPRPIGDDVLLPNADWTSASTIQWRNRVLTGIAAVVGIVLAMLLIVATTLISAGNAIVRKTFNTSSNAFLEIQWYLFAAVFMLGSGYAFMRNAHVRIDFISSKFSPRGRNWVDVIGIVVFVFPLCYLMITLAWPLFTNAYASG